MIPISVASMPLLEVKESYIMGNKVIENINFFKGILKAN